jgi:hypothetical protein
LGGSFASDQTHIFDPVTQAMLHQRIEPVDDGGNDLLIPEQKAAIASVWVEHEAQADIIAFALHAIHPPATASKPHVACSAHAHSIGCLIGTGRQGLGHRGIDMLGNPGDAGVLGILMQVVFGKVVLFAQSRKSLGAFLFVRARQSTRLCPGGIVAHSSQAFVGFRKQSVIQTPCRLQVSAEVVLLVPIDVKG